MFQQTFVRLRPSARRISYYITTPIFYVNSYPHIGHVHTLLLADAINIHQRLKLCSNDTIFSTGVDEHGMKVQTAALAKGVDCHKFCDTNSQKFLSAFNHYNTTFTHFVRTSDEKHKSTVRAIWNVLKDKDFIYKDTYSGWYCRSDETFVPESQVTKNETPTGETVYLDENKKQVLWSSEENYMFRMSKVSQDVLKWLVDERPIIPEVFNNLAIHMLKSHENSDISISRPSKRISWGIRVPNDDEQVIYVWLDALTNYLTVVGYRGPGSQLMRWPVDCQVLGKDILKFHAIYWPAFLRAIDLPLPRRLICHSHWLIDSMKMSKSLGNVIEPVEESRILTPEGLRYYLLRGAVPSYDTDYSKSSAITRVNAELADTYGNLLSRCCSNALNPQQEIPLSLVGNIDEGVQQAIDSLTNLSGVCDDHYTDANFYKGVDEIMRILRLVNKLFHDTEPWKLVKEVNENRHSMIRYNNLLVVSFEALRICSILLQPIVPQISNSALNRLGVSERFWKDSRLIIKRGDLEMCKRSLVGPGQPTLFKKIKDVY